MKKGVFTYRNDISLDKQHELIKSSGFDSVMIWWSNKKDEYIKMANRYNLEICNAHLPFDDIKKIWLPNDNDGDNYTLWLCEQIKECGNKEIETVVMHLSRGIDTHPVNNCGLDRIKKIVNTAEKSNVKIAFENLRLLNYLDFIFENVKSQNIGFCYDSGHQNCFTPQRDVLNDYKDKLMALHIADNYGDADIHSLPYDGTVDFKHFAKQLANTNYDGVLSLEVQQERNPIYENLNPQEFFELSFERAVKFENEIKSFYR